MGVRIAVIFVCSQNFRPPCLSNFSDCPQFSIVKSRCLYTSIFRSEFLSSLHVRTMTQLFFWSAANGTGKHIAISTMKIISECVVETSVGECQEKNLTIFASQGAYSLTRFLPLSVQTRLVSAGRDDRFVINLPTTVIKNDNVVSLSHVLSTAPLHERWFPARVKIQAYVTSCLRVFLFSRWFPGSSHPGSSLVSGARRHVALSSLLSVLKLDQSRRLTTVIPKFPLSFNWILHDARTYRLLLPLRRSPLLILLSIPRQSLHRNTLPYEISIHNARITRK